MLIRTATLACAFALSLVAPQFAAAQCETGDCGSTTTTTSSSYGSALQSDWHAFKNRFKLDTDRNEAWPHPFLATDRQAYRDMWRPCYDRGWEIEHTLSNECFDAETGELNRMGAAKVAQLVQAAPKNRKTLFIHQGGSAELAAARLDLVQKYIQVEYGRQAGVMVATTENFPVTGRGTYAELITRQWQTSLPRPALSGNSVSSAIAGGN